MVGVNLDFPDSFGDARLEELKLLSWTDQRGELTFASVPSGAWQDLLVSLVWSGLLTAVCGRTVWSAVAAVVPKSRDRQPRPPNAPYSGNWCRARLTGR
jgi:hypothetical protein